MSKNTPAFVSAVGGSLIALCVVLAGAGIGSAAPSSEDGPENPPTTTTTPTTQGNPWHG